MHKYWVSKIKYLLFIILVTGFLFRIYGLNWDQNQHLHPDERFLTMVVGAFKNPPSLFNYLNPSISTFNPNNIGYQFFVYGTLPLYLTKIVSDIVKFDIFSYNNITLVGRLLSAIFDTGVIFLVFKISKKIFNEKVALTAAMLYAVMVLPIQLSHFFAVDTFLNFFLVLSFYFLIKNVEGKNNSALVNPILLGLSFGLAMACKISAVLFLPIIGLFLLFGFYKKRNFKQFIILTSLFIIFTLLVIRIADPHFFTSQFIKNLQQLKAFDDPNSLYPPGIQWITTKRIIFPFKNIILWGLGLPLGIISIIALIYSVIDIIKKIKKIPSSTHLFIYLLTVVWILFLFTYQGIQFSKTMRYFLPIYPFLAILAANFIQKVVLLKVKPFIRYSLFMILAIYPISFLAIYSRPHSRVTASEWIYANIPAGSTISCEYWDDCLPLPLNNKAAYFYNSQTLDLFAADTNGKWFKINNQLNNIDYLILSSNRLWGSIPKVPDKYPVTSKFYNDLLAGKTNFKLIAEISSYPTIPILNIAIPDESAEEAFTVYDHPKVLIFKNDKVNQSF